MTVRRSAPKRGRVVRRQAFTFILAFDDALTGYYRGAMASRACHRATRRKFASPAPVLKGGFGSA